MAKDVKPAIRAKFNEKHIIRPTRPTVEQAFTQFVETMKAERKPSTIQTYDTMMNQHLIPYCEETSRVLTWSLFDPDFGAHWKQYFVKHRKQDSTAGKNFRRLHTFLKWASKRGYLGTNYFRDWNRIKEKSNEPIVCTEDDLTKIQAYAENVEKKKELRQTADMFLFMCYTGLRIGDFMDLRYRNLHYESSGEGKKSERYLLKINSEKTDVLLTIPLTDDAFQLIIRYNQPLAATFHHYKYKADNKAGFLYGLTYDVNPVIKQHPNWRLFPRVLQQDINENIKIIGEECGIDASYERIERFGAERVKTYKPKYALMTCHTARRTFITLALQAEINERVIMKFTGHTSTKSIARYYSISEEYLIKQMERFKDKATPRKYSMMEQRFRSTFY